MVRKIFVAVAFVLGVSGCVPSYHYTGAGNGLVNNSKSFAFSEQDIILSPQAHKVTMHPEGPLMASNYCSSMVTSHFYSRFGFDNTLVALRNRGALIGSNAVAIRSWTVRDRDASIIARFYHCSLKRGL